MRVCHVSTFWPNRFGHTHYADNLIRGMRVHEREKHYVVAEHPSAAASTDDYEVVPCWRRDQDYVDDVVRGVAQVKADVAIFQYSNDLFGDDDRLPRVLARLREQGVCTVINTHSIYPEGWRTGYQPGRTAADFDRALGREASLLTVHSARMKRDLEARGIAPEKVAIIPHGSKPMEQQDIAASRAKLGLPADAKVVLFFGFIWLGKGIDFLLSAFARVARRMPDAHLVVAGHTRLRRFGFYVRYLQARAALLGISRRTKFWGQYVPDADVPTIYSSADVVAMPYRQDYSSVSGVVHQTAGIGKLMLCSRIAKFDEVTESIDPRLALDPHDLDGWADGLQRLLTDTAFAAEMRAKISDFGARTAWDAVGALHLQTYRQLLDRSPGRC